jgi:hypothetical protein
MRIILPIICKLAGNSNFDWFSAFTAACLACGNFVATFPNESKESLVELMPLFFENLEDNIPSVRQGAAISLGKVTSVYGDDVNSTVLDKIKTSFDSVEKQPAESVRLREFDRGPATFGVAKRITQDDPDIHSNQIVS